MLPLLFSAVLLLAATGCMSVPDPSSIPADVTVNQLKQKGQEAFDYNNLKAAEVYYQIIIDRFGTDMSALTAAEFEIAHLRIKEKKWTDARTRLETIIARYDGEGGATLPPEYLVLAKNDLARIPATAKKPVAVKTPAVVAAPVVSPVPATTTDPAPVAAPVVSPAPATTTDPATISAPVTAPTTGTVPAGQTTMTP
jgi:hypothetical protein